ncbi:MAG: NusG domain II-containing protein [Clostridia bacterium]|nr:NusG domain II-containing protein [Clostridia bacterium]
MKKKDFLIAGAVLLLAGVLTLVLRLSGGDPGGAVQVKIDGKVVGTYALVEEQAVPFDTDYGHNLLVIRDGKAHMEEADCPDHYCMEQGEIEKTGETLVCLPHKLVVEVVSGESSDVDVVAK